MSHATMTFQTKEQNSPRYNWRSVLITLFIFAVLGGGGWWADQAGWLGRFLGQSTGVVTTTNSQASANQAQPNPSVTTNSVQAPTVQRTQANVTAKSTTSAKVSKATATPAVAPVTLPVVAGVHGAQLWDQTGKQVTTLDTGALLTAKGRSMDGAWLAVTTNAGAGWVQTSQVVAYDVQSLAVTTPPTAVTPAVQQAQTTPAATTPATTAVVSPAAVKTPVATQLTATVATTAGKLNVRSGPGTNYTILTKVNTGDELVVRGRNATGDWLQVQVAGATADTGWVAAQYVTFTGDMNALPVSTT